MAAAGAATSSNVGTGSAIVAGAASACGMAGSTAGVGSENEVGSGVLGVGVFDVLGVLKGALAMNSAVF